MYKVLPTVCLIACCLAITRPARAQEDQPGTVEKLLRVEIPVKSDNETYRLLPCGPSGVMLFFKSLETVQDSLSKWYFSFYDVHLKLAWVKAVPLSGTLEYRAGTFSGDTLFLLFQPSEKEKKPDFLMLRIALAKPSFIGNTGRMPKNLKFSGFEVGSGKAFLGFQAPGWPAVVQILDLGSGISRTIQLTSDTVSSIADMAEDPLTGNFLVAFKKEISKTGSEFFVGRYSSSGDRLAEVLVSTISPEREIRTLQLCPRDRDELLILGTYGSRTHGKSSSRKETQAESTGFYFTRIVDGRQDHISFINFLDLKNSSNLLGEQDVMTLKKKSLKKSGSDHEFSIDFNILLHPVLFHKDQILFLAETYYPEYHAENFTDFDFYGQPFVNTYNVFDGYRFSNAIITCFNDDGKLLWDNTLEIRNLISFQLDPKVQVYLSGDEVVLAYQSEGKIGSKILRGPDVVEKLDFSAVEMSSEEDKLLSETKSRLASWYGNFFLSYGYQEIKNITDGNKRMVFYFTKIRFE